MKAFLLIITLLFSINCMAQVVTIYTTSNDSLTGNIQYYRNNYLSFKIKDTRSFKKINFSEISNVNGNLPRGEVKLFQKRNPEITFNKSNPTKILAVKSDAIYKKIDNISQLEYNQDYTRFCLKKYHDQRIKAYKFQIAGMLVGAAAFIIPPSETEEYYYQNDNPYWVTTPDYTLRKIGAYTGGALTLIGTIMLIDSEKWLNKIYIGPNGVGIKFQF